MIKVLLDCKKPKLHKLDNLSEYFKYSDFEGNTGILKTQFNQLSANQELQLSAGTYLISFNHTGYSRYSYASVISLAGYTGESDTWVKINSIIQYTNYSDNVTSLSVNLKEMKIKNTGSVILKLYITRIA